MKKHAVRLFLGMLAVLLVSSVSFAVPEEKTSSATATKSAVKKQRKKSAAETNLLDINTASTEQLSALPGLTSGDAKKIIAGRPYTRKNQLKQKNIITAAAYDGIKGQIVAKRQKK
jgi:DNA uptake protein ComE-like DNA-binding protein